jgi:tryptophan-rich sensory protein
VIFKPGPWYEGLNKPGFTPPNWAFPVAWTIIYLLAGLGRLSLEPDSRQSDRVGAVAAQIALNTLWTPVFFGAHQVLAAMVILLVLWLVVAAMVFLAMRLDVITGLILFPYLAWLCVAAALNFWDFAQQPWVIKRKQPMFIGVLKGLDFIYENRDSPILPIRKTSRIRKRSE